MIEAIVFDLDGTLLHTVPDIAAAMNRALSACGLPTHEQAVVETFLGGGIRDAVLKATPNGTDEDTIERVLDLYREDYLHHCTDQTAPYDGVMEMVAEFVRRGKKLVVLSNKTETTAQKIVSHFFPEGQFTATFGRVPERPLKPHVDAARPVFDTLGIAPEKIAYVGDSNTDILFGKAAGMFTVATPWGYRSREELLAVEPDLMVEHPLELLQMLG
ncbi:MAG: HAD family hydrolase [Oscillospiraceae bacterium]|nr:HAD family hydrolase [Oscillospiraceae bacterium]